MNLIRLFAASLALLFGTLGGANAQGAPADTAPTSKPPPAFSRVEAARFAGVAALGGLAYLGDDAARRAVRGDAPQRSRVLKRVADVGDVYGQPGVVGLGLLMWGGGLLADRPAVAASGLRAIEALTVSGFVTLALKETMGRARPSVPPSARDDWQLLRGARTQGGDYESMASGHVTAAFAFATAVTAEVAHRAPRHARSVGALTFTAAGVTAYARMHGDRHWLSDATVGAGVGTVTALAIARWHATRPDNVIDRWFLRPVIAPTQDGGMRLGIELQRR